MTQQTTFDWEIQIPEPIAEGPARDIEMRLYDEAEGLTDIQWQTQWEAE